jgi:DNA adenine methylase
VSLYLPLELLVDSSLMAHTIVKRVGGKVKIAPWIREHLPIHNLFCEPFGGSFAVGLGLSRANDSSYRVIYNDLDRHVHNFFQVLRDHKEEFLEKLEFSPYERQEFIRAYEVIHSDGEWLKLSPVEWARLYLISNRQSFAGKEDKTWSISRQGENNPHTWRGLPKLAAEVADHLKYAFIENSDYRDTFRRWDSPETVFYVDPPYEHVEGDYYHVNKAGGFNHAEMAEEISKLQGSVVVSYYQTDSIIALYPGFEIVTREVTKHMQTKAIKDKVQEMLLIKKSEWAKQVNNSNLL